jgi:flagellar FliL protein
MSDDKVGAPKKKGGMMKLIVIALGAVIVTGGGTVGALWATGMLGHATAAEAAEANGPKLVPKSEQKRASGGEGGEGKASAGNKPPSGVGGDQYASNYYAMDKDFTSNLQGSVHYIQVGLAISTPYDDTVIENIKTNEIAVRSAILMALGDTPEDQITTSDGKKALQARLVKAINDTLKQKEGFGGVSNVYFTNFVVQ